MTGMSSVNRTDGYVDALPVGLVRCADGLVRVGGHGRVVPEWELDRSVPVPEPDRATRVASWLGWHVMELAGVVVPAGAAVAVTPWAWLVSGVVAAGWAVREIRAAAAQAPLKSELAARRAATGHRTSAGSNVDGMDATPDGPAPDDDAGDDVVVGPGGFGAVGGVA